LRATFSEMLGMGWLSRGGGLGFGLVFLGCSALALLC